MKFQYDSPPSNSIFKRVGIYKTSSKRIWLQFSGCNDARCLTTSLESQELCDVATVCVQSCVILDASDILQIGMQALPPGSKLNLVGRMSGKIMQNRFMHKLV